jgi:protein gp37
LQDFTTLSLEPLLEALDPINLEGISCVIWGGESGAGARPIEEEWVLSIKEQYRQVQVPFFFKQWEWDGWNKKAASRILKAALSMRCRPGCRTRCRTGRNAGR